jgi:hypothetical protein
LRSATASVNLKLPPDQASPTFAHISRIGGWSLYVENGVPAYHYNFLGLERTTIAGTGPLSAGSHEIRFDFGYAGDGLGKGGTGSLLVDGVEVASGSIPRTQPTIFSADETTDVGIDGRVANAVEIPWRRAPGM